MTNYTLDKFKRLQSGFCLHHMFPYVEGICGCGCGTILTGRKKRWASEQCSKNAFAEFAIIQGNTGVIRTNLFIRDKGFCQHCGLLTDDWQADHIIPVHQGGGATGLWNFQTLCVDCHKKKSKADFKQNHRTKQTRTNTLNTNTIF